MKILCVSTAAIETPPSEDGYGGMEREMAWLVRGLTELGHECEVLARTGSKAGTLFADDEKDFVATVGNKIDSYDIVIDFSHDKMIGRQYPEKPQINTYQVMTVGHKVNPVFISRGQRDYIGIDGPVIYYGIDLDAYEPNYQERDDYLLYIGSLITEKRPHWVAELANKMGYKAIIAGPAWQPEYWPIKDEISEMEHVTVLDEVAGQEKLDLIRNAAALVHPVGGKGWVEAGAIIVLEALACGTPVIATPNGCLPEYIHENINGFLCVNVPEMMLGMNRLWNITAKRCRLSVLNFNYKRMAEDYEALAKEVLKGKRW